MNRKVEQSRPQLPRRVILKAIVVGAAAKLPLSALSETEQGTPIRDLTAASAVRLAGAIRRREVSCVEVIDAYLLRIKALNPALNAVVQLNANARDAAAAADRALRKRDHLGPLHGVPITVKDSFDTAGIVTTAGTTGR